MPDIADGLRVLILNVGRKTRRYKWSAYSCNVAVQGLAAFQVTQGKSCLSLSSDATDDLCIPVFN